MPFYEFECKKCNKTFTLVMTLEKYKKGNIKCPECWSKEVERVYSQFYSFTSKKYIKKELECD